MVLAAYVALAVAGVPFVQATTGSLAYIAYALVITACFVAICWLKGEPPRWRWGEHDR